MGHVHAFACVYPCVESIYCACCCPFSLWVIPVLVAVAKSALHTLNLSHTHTYIRSYIQLYTSSVHCFPLCVCVYMLRIRRVAHCVPHLESPVAASRFVPRCLFVYITHMRNATTKATTMTNKK